MSLPHLPRSLRQFDAFAKPLKDFKVQTVPGAIMTIICFIIISCLFIAEFIDFISPSTKQEIFVDISRDTKMTIDFDIAFPFVPCHALSVDSMDVSGDHQTGIKKEINKIPISPSGDNLPSALLESDEATTNISLADKRGPDYCGSCYGAAADAKTCCNSCDAVLEAYRLKGWVVPNVEAFEQCREERATGLRSKLGKQGCRLVGHMGVNKVAGSFHISPGKSYGQGHVHVHDLQALAGAQLNLSHNINTLTFGAAYPGHRNPLDGSNVSVELQIEEAATRNTVRVRISFEKLGSFEWPLEESPMVSYFLKLVPTLYLDSKQNMVTTHQYSATWRTRLTPLSGASDGVPGVFFNYEISPLLVKLTEERKSFLHFLTNTCAIIGGVFTVASLLDAFVYRSLCFFEKMQ